MECVAWRGRQTVCSQVRKPLEPCQEPPVCSVVFVFLANEIRQERPKKAGDGGSAPSGDDLYFLKYVFRQRQGNILRIHTESGGYVDT